MPLNVLMWLTVSFDGLREIRNKRRLRLGTSIQKSNLLVLNNFAACVFATISAYLLPEMRICYRSKYAQCVFATRNAYLLQITVANTHSEYLLPKLRICYRSKYSG